MGQSLAIATSSCTPNSILSFSTTKLVERVRSY